MKPRTALAVAVLAGATTAPACNFIGITPAGAQAPNCGGNSTVHPAPIDCENTRTISGIRGSVRLVVDETGYVMVTAVVQDLTPNTPLPPLFLQVKAHRGVSSNEGFEGGTDVFDGNTASLELTMPRSLADNCTSQIDVKIAPGQPTLDHISPDFRFAAPLVGIDLAYCQPATTVTTVPDSAPSTSAPGPTVPQTSPPSSVGGSTTAAPTATSGPGAALPATGNPMDVIGGIIAALLVTALGVLLVIGVRRSPAS
jgi:hypothetical protein